ncbi:hypothetical protein BG004_006368 [Podila humilis]|nr:hypothetical protein BG004_006368 [Podila humilis]
MTTRRHSDVLPLDPPHTNLQHYDIVIPGIDTVPLELLIDVVRRLDPPSLFNASVTCQLWRRIINEYEWYRACKYLLPRWTHSLQMNELRGDRAWERYTYETYLRSHRRWRAPVQPFATSQEISRASKLSLPSSSSLSPAPQPNDDDPLINLIYDSDLPIPDRSFLQVPRDQFTRICSPMSDPKLAWQNIGPPIPHTPQSSRKTIIAFMQARTFKSDFVHRIALYHKQDLTTPCAIIGDDFWRGQHGPYANRPWYWPFQCHQLQVAQVMGFTYYPDQCDAFGRVKLIVVIALGENSGPIGGSDGEMHVLDVWLTIKVLEVYVHLEAPNAPSRHASASSFDSPADDGPFLTAIETIVPYHHNNEVIRGRMASTYQQENKSTGILEDWIAIFGIRHAADSHAVVLSKRLFADDMPTSLFRQTRRQYLFPQLQRAHTTQRPTSSNAQTSHQTTPNNSSTSLATLHHLSLPNSINEFSSTGPQQQLGIQAKSPTPPPARRFVEIAAGASCMSLFPANSDFKHLMIVVTAEGEGFIFDWLHERRVAVLRSSYSKKHRKVEKCRRKNKALAAVHPSQHGNAFADNVDPTVPIAEEPTVAHDRKLYHWGVQVNWAIEGPYDNELVGPRKQGSFRIVAMADGTHKEWQSSYWHVDEDILRNPADRHLAICETARTSESTLGKRTKNPAVEDEVLTNLENLELRCAISGDSADSQPKTKHFKAGDTRKTDMDMEEDTVSSRDQIDSKDCRTIASLIGSGDAGQVLYQFPRLRERTDSPLSAPTISGQLQSITTFNQNDHEAAKKLPKLYTRNRHSVLQTTGLSRDSFQQVVKTVGAERSSANPFFPYQVEVHGFFRAEQSGASKDNNDNVNGDRNMAPDPIPTSAPSPAPLLDGADNTTEASIREDADTEEKALLFIAYLIWDHYRIALTSDYGLCLIDMDKEFTGDIASPHYEWVTFLEDSKDEPNPMVDIAIIDDSLFITRKYSHDIWPFRSVLRTARVS